MIKIAKTLDAALGSGVPSINANDTKLAPTSAVQEVKFHKIESAGMAELADAEDLKSSGEIFVGSSPSPGTR
jgi:hypothetical protein